MIRETAVQERFKIPEEVHPLGKSITEDHDAVVLLYLEVAGLRC